MTPDEVGQIFAELWAATETGDIFLFDAALDKLSILQKQCVQKHCNKAKQVA
jgi:hypothetical protein